MALVSLIFPVAPGTSPNGRPALFRQVLEGQGHRVETLVVSGPGFRPQDHAEYPDRALTAEEPGLAVAAVAGLRQARGDMLVVVDLEHDYEPASLIKLLDPLENGDADLVVARRTGRGRRWVTWIGSLARPLLGASDPLSGLIALTRKALRDVEETLAPVGSRFVLELLVRVDGKGGEVPIAVGPVARSSRFSLTDMRHIKRLADDRFGNLSRLIQFCLVGASGMVVDLTCYALFQLVFSRTPLAGLTAPVFGGALDLAVAGALAIAVALVWNFSLNRRLTFSYARRGSLIRQFITYALSNALGIALSFSLRLVLPLHVGFFHRHRLAAAVVGIVAATGISFSMSRWVVFSRRSVERDHALALAEPSPAP